MKSQIDLKPVIMSKLRLFYTIWRDIARSTELIRVSGYREKNFLFIREDGSIRLLRHYNITSFDMRVFRPLILELKERAYE